MTHPVSNRIEAMEASQTVAMNQRSTDLQQQGIDIINLSVGEPDFPTPDHIKEAAFQAIRDNYTKYSPVPGYPILKSAIIQKMKEDNNLIYKPSEVIVSNGAKHALANTIMTIINPGDEVIVPSPYWVSYTELIKLAEGNSIIIDGLAKNRFKITATQLEKAITPKTKALLLCSPSNPTGSVYNKEELSSMVEVLKKHPNILVISDEIYEYINFKGNHVSIAQFEGMQERTIIINGVSKGFSMTGWRIGFACGPEWLISASTKLQSQFTTGPCSVSQMASVVALTANKQPSKDMVKAFKRRCDKVLAWINEIPGLSCEEPDGAFYVFPDVRTFLNKSYQGKVIKTDTDLCYFLLDEAHVGTVPGDAFGYPGFIRISYATDDALLEKAFRQIKVALAKLE